MESLPKTVLVTGGAGYIGSATVEALIKDNYKVIVFDNLSTGQKIKVSTEAVMMQGDVQNMADLEKAFGQHQIDAVIHFAAKKSVSESQQNPAKYFLNNVLGTLNILTCMEKYNVPKIVFSSTAAVYQAVDTSDHIFTETSAVSPSSVYGQSKLMAETLIKEFCNTGKISSYVILRYFNVAGDSGLQYREDAAENVFPLLAKALEQNLTFNIFGDDYPTKDGTGVRDYIHLTDLVTAHLKALPQDKTGVFNLGTGKGYSVQDLLQSFESVTGKNISTETKSRRSGDVATVVADASKAEIELDWAPQEDLSAMVESTVAVYINKT